MSSCVSSSDQNARGCQSIAAPFERLAPFYDALYTRAGKDFRAEAESISAFARGNNPNASTLLDVGCGTGAHLRWWQDEFECVGVDRSQTMLEVARLAAPAAALVNADMESFRLGRQFDIVTCLFASLAYLPSADAAAKAIRTMTQHLAPHGVLILEPGVLLDDLKPPVSSVFETEIGGTTVRRETSAVVVDRRLDITFEFRAEYSNGATERFREVHSMLLQSCDELASMLRTAELNFELEAIPNRNQFMYTCQK